MAHLSQISDVNSILEQLERASELEDLQSAIVALRDAYGVHHMVYHWVNASGDQYGCGTYAPVWVERYLDQEYLKIDPVILGCFKRFHPVDWKRLDWTSKAARHFRKEAVEYGVGNQGYSIPLRGPNGQFALFTVSHNCSDMSWTEFTDLNRRNLLLLAHCFNQKALEFEPDRLPEAARGLSPREVDAMTYIAHGLNRAQTAQSMSISEHTLRVYIESARFKLGAMNTTHAVAKAMSRGLIVV